MTWQNNQEYTYMVGVAGILLTVVGWISLRRGPGLTQRQMETNARICYIIGTLKLIAGIFVLTSMYNGELWGFMLILFGVLWVIRGNRWKRVALVVRARNQRRNNGIGAVIAGRNNNNNPDYRRIPEVDGPEGPNNNNDGVGGGGGGAGPPMLIQVHQQAPIIARNAAQCGYPGIVAALQPCNGNGNGTAAAANGSNTIIPQSQFGVVMNNNESNNNNSNNNGAGAVPPAAFPGPGYSVIPMPSSTAGPMTTDKSHNNKKMNDELQVPLKLSVDETAPVPFSITPNLNEMNHGNSEMGEGEATYS